MTIRLENRYNLPDAVVRAVAADPYDSAGSYLTASSLADPPQQRALIAKHGDELSEDVTERLWSLLGTAVHIVLERADAANAATLNEQRFFAEFLGQRISGKLDHYSLENGVLADYKCTSAWSLVFKDRYRDWTRQLNCMAELLARNGHAVTGIQVVAILRDWQESKARDKSDYPQQAIAVVPLELWPQEKRAEYIESRVALHLAADAGEMPPCTDEERWARPSKYAVMKPGRKTALKVCDSAEDADSIAAQTPGAFVVKRPGGFARCELNELGHAYCAASPVCPQAAQDRATEAS